MSIENVVYIAIAAFLIGMLIGYLLWKPSKKQEYDGRLVIGEEDGRDQFRFIFSKDLEDIQNQETLLFEIVKTQNSQAL